MMLVPLAAWWQCGLLVVSLAGRGRRHELWGEAPTTWTNGRSRRGSPARPSSPLPALSSSCSSATRLITSRPGHPSRTEGFAVAAGGKDSGRNVKPDEAEQESNGDRFGRAGATMIGSAIVVTGERDIEASPGEAKAAWKELAGAKAVATESDEQGGKTSSSSWLGVWTPAQVLDESDEHVRFLLPLGPVLSRLLDSGDGTASGTMSTAAESTVRLLALGSRRNDLDAHRCRLAWEVRMPLPASRPDRPNDLARFLAEALIKWRMSSLADAVEGRVSEPLLLTRRLRLPARTSQQKAIAAADAMEAWLEFVWREGGGLPTPLPPVPLPPPRSRSPTAAEGDANHIKTSRRLILPPGLVESLVRVDNETHQIEYRVHNPGWFTYPVHTHRGLVSFRLETSDGDNGDGGDGDRGVVLEWKVEIRPFVRVKFWVRAFTEAVVTTLTRNLAVHVRDPAARVRVSPPRGKGRSFASVRRDSWLGGVLDAHLADSRSAGEQTLSLLQPWTWGRSVDDAGSASTTWTTGRLRDR